MDAPEGPAYVLPMLSRSLCFLGLGAVAIAACGGRTPPRIEETDVTLPEMLFVEAEDACGAAADVDDAAELLTPADSGEDLVVVEIYFADECTGLGGQHILARTTDGQLEMWLGAHGCRFFEDELRTDEPRYGLARISFTAALFTIDPNVCVSFPGSVEGPSSSLKVRTVAVFRSRSEAERFSASIE